MPQFPVGGDPVVAPDDLSGWLLAATPTMRDSNFDDTVVFVISHGVDGAIGVVINEPTDVASHQALFGWDEVVAPPEVLFAGGPVNDEAVIALARTDARLDTLRPVEGCPAVSTVDLGADLALLEPHIERVRVFVGYAGWSPGQLEGEIAAGAWFVFPTEIDDLFALRPDLVRSAVFLRQRNEHRIFALYPDDPRSN